MKLYTDSSFTYSWNESAAGETRQQLCPEVCEEVARYVEEAVVIRRCVSVDGGAEWEAVDFTGCGLNTAAFRLCEATQVCMHSLINASLCSNSSTLQC